MGGPYADQPTGARSLESLLGEVVSARSAQQTVQRRPGIGADALAQVHWATLRALEDYAAAVERRGWPVPREIRRDLHLHRALCGVPVDGGAATRAADY